MARKTTKFQKTVLTILVMVLSLGLLLPYMMALLTAIF